MTFKKALLLPGTATVVVLIAILGALLLLQPAEQSRPTFDLSVPYIMDARTGSMPVQDLLPRGTRLPGGEPASDALTFFRALERHFAQPSPDNLDEHYKKVRTFLEDQWEPDDVRRIFGLYRDYLDCEIQLSRDSRFKTAYSSLELLSVLNAMHEFRRSRLGRDNADLLFGPEVKAREFQLRRSIILDDPALYGKEKQAMLKDLNTGIWGDQPPPSGQALTDYDRYQLKQRLYRRDLAEMNDADRQRLLEEFQRECFSREALDRLHAAERRIDEEKETLKEYRLAEQEVLKDEALNPDEQQQQLQALQDTFFGGNADSFRRREAMYHDKQSRRNPDEAL